MISSYTDKLPRTLEYRPAGINMWDTWCIERAGEVHLFHLQAQAHESTRPKEDLQWLGHAVSRDLIHWQERPLAIPPNVPGTLDDMQIWTGCVMEHAGLYYLYFTMRSTRDEGNGQHIGLATSPDLETWTRHPGNPVISPDPAYYISHEKPLPAPHFTHQDRTRIRGTVDCRDLVIFPDPSGKGWFGFYAARVWAEEGPEQSVIATVHTTDLIHWKHLPPAFAPKKYNCIEVPDVFQLNGRWYMTCLTGHYMGSRGIFTDPYFNRGTIYAVADCPEGPYREFAEDNVLIGGNDLSCGYSCRTVVFEGERLELFTQLCPQENWMATVSPPYTLRTTTEGYLRLGYCDRVKGWRTSTLIEPGVTPAISRLPCNHPQWVVEGGRWRLEQNVYHGESRSGSQIAYLPAAAHNLEAEATIVIENGVAAGLAFRSGQGQQASWGDYVVALDARESCVLAGRTLEFEELHRRRIKVEYGKPYRLHVCIRGSRFDVFVDGELMLQFGMRQPIPTGLHDIGLFVDRAHCRISDLAAYVLAEV